MFSPDTLRRIIVSFIEEPTTCSHCMFQRTWKILNSSLEQSLSCNTLVLKGNFQYSRTILHFQSTNTFSSVLYVSTKTDNNNCVVSFCKTSGKLYFVSYFTHKKTYLYKFLYIPITKNLDNRQLLSGMLVHVCLHGTVFHGVPTQTI